MTNYSQNNIEEIVNAIYPIRNYKGYFVEVGCWDGEIISQTKKLEEQGWTGLCIDPFPHGNFENRKCRLVKSAIGLKWGSRQFMKVTRDRRPGYGDVSYFSGFVDVVKDHLQLIMDHCDYTIETVIVRPLQKILERYESPPFIEFLSVDVEGAELEVFQSIDWNLQKFGIITYEHNEDIVRRDQIREFLVEKGYELYAQYRIDDVFVGSGL